MKIKSIVRVLVVFVLLLIIVGCEYKSVEYTRPASEAQAPLPSNNVVEPVNQPIPPPPSLPTDETENQDIEPETSKPTPPQFPE